MEVQKTDRLSQQDWINAAIKVLHEKGVEAVKIVVIARTMRVTSGSFYWHFKKLQDLLDAILNHWEHHLTDHIIKDTLAFAGPPDQQIFQLMKQVIREGGAEPDHAIAVWARTDENVRTIYERTLERRFAFATWMFAEAGFAPAEAAARGRLMVAYLMGESSTSLKLQSDWEDTLENQFRVLMLSAS